MAKKITNEILQLLLPRPEDSHKGTFGTLNALVGSSNMPGAAYLAALSALRSGIGLLRIATEENSKMVLQSQLAEPVWISLNDLIEQKCNAFLCGCGIGRTYDTLLEKIIPSLHVPSVFDADALNYLALHHDILSQLPAQSILTPHPAEFSRLIEIPVAEIQSNRELLAKQFATAYHCTVVLKGHETVIADENETYINSTGNSALAKGGSGDVLAGLIAGLLTQGHSPFVAASIGVYVHGLAGDMLSQEYGKHGVLPSDLPMKIGSILK